MSKRVNTKRATVFRRDSIATRTYAAADATTTQSTEA